MTPTSPQRSPPPQPTQSVVADHNGILYFHRSGLALEVVRVAGELRALWRYRGRAVAGPLVGLA